MRTNCRDFYTCARRTFPAPQTDRQSRNVRLARFGVQPPAIDRFAWASEKDARATSGFRQHIITRFCDARLAAKFLSALMLAVLAPIASLVNDKAWEPILMSVATAISLLLPKRLLNGHKSDLLRYLVRTRAKTIADQLLSHPNKNEIKTVLRALDQLDPNKAQEVWSYIINHKLVSLVI
jgi:hypothetical protein